MPNAWAVVVLSVNNLARLPSEKQVDPLLRPDKMPRLPRLPRLLRRPFNNRSVALGAPCWAVWPQDWAWHG